MLKLFVWHDVFYDYTAGVAFALAEDADQARERIADSYVKGMILSSWKGAARVAERKRLREECMRELKAKPKVYSSAKGDFIYGGS